MKHLLDLTDLRLFANVVDGGSITSGAAASHMSLAAASERLIGLEAALETALLVRGRRGVTATAAGEVLLTHARTVLQQAQQMQADVSRAAQRQVTRVRLAGNSSALREFVLDALGRFLAARREVNVELDERVPDAAVAATLEGAADLAIVPEGTARDGLQSLALCSAGYAVLVPAGHPMAEEAARGPVTMRSTDRKDVVGLPEGSALQQTWEARAALRGNRLNYRVRVPGFEAQARLVARGVGVALMPRSAAERLVGRWNVQAVPMADPFLNEGQVLCARDWQALSPAARALAQALLGHEPA